MSDYIHIFLRFRGRNLHGCREIPVNILILMESLKTDEPELNSLRPRQNGRYLADDTFKRILLNENVRSWIKNSLKFVPNGPINNIPALVQIMAWRRLGDKPLSEPMIVILSTHICVTRPHWVKVLFKVIHTMKLVINNLDNVFISLLSHSWLIHFFTYTCFINHI